MANKKHPEGFICKHCGNCCTNYSDAVGPFLTNKEVERLRSFYASFNIMDYLEALHLPSGKFVGFDAWFSPVTGEELHRCPWLRKLPNKEEYKCRIHEAKPEKCFNFPQIDQKESALEHGCQGWNHLKEKID
jgi:Fe-S-cluster containining protein